MRRLAVLVLCATATTLPARAQDSSVGRGFCFTAHPRPACSVFLITHAGGFIRFPIPQSEPPVLIALDWGVMFNADDRTAIGVSLFGVFDADGPHVGPAVRYRRWLSRGRHLEVAVGLPVVVKPQDTGAGVLGLVRFSPTDWLALTVRPAMVHTASTCDLNGCRPDDRWRGRAGVGGELGSVPGLVASVVGTVTAFVLIVQGLAQS